MKTSRRCILLALIALAAPLFADWPEVQIGATVRAPAPGWRDYLAAATDGTDFFVVWHDARTPGRSAIMGTRLTRSGEVLDPLGIRITSVPAWMSEPTAVWDGAAYLVAWTQGPYYGETRQKDEVWITRVDRDGSVLAAPRLIAEDTKTTSGVYAASNGSVTVIAYRDSHNASAVRIAVLDREGNLIRREALTNPSPDFARTISVAATPTRFVVTWGGESQLFAMALGSDGRAVGTPAEIGTGADPVIATDGTSFTIAWHRWMPELSEFVLMARTVDAELAPIGDVQTLSSDRLIYSVSLLWRGDRYEIVAGHQAEPQGAYGLLSIELPRDGGRRVSRRRGEPVYPWDHPQPVAVTNGSDVLVAYGNGEGFSIEIAARLYRGSSPEPDVQELLTWSGNAHTRPAIASSASGHLAAWIENLSVYATRIDANGNSLDGRGLEITTEAYAVRVAFDGTNYVVAWQGTLTIAIRYISPATGATVAQVHVPALVRKSFALAVSPEAAYVAWDELDKRVRITRVSPATEMAGLPLVVSPAEMSSEHPAIAWNGSMLLVAWNEMELAPGDAPTLRALHIRAARVSRGLSLLDPAPMIVATPGVARPFPPDAPSMASNGEDWLIVSELDEQQLVARRVLRSGNVEGTAASPVGDGVAPAVTWDGTRYAIAYRSGANDVLPEHPLLLGEVPAAGALPRMRPKLVSTRVVGPPSIARTPAGDVAIVYTKVSFRPEHMGLERSYFRVMDFSRRRHAVRH